MQENKAEELEQLKNENKVLLIKIAELQEKALEYQDEKILFLETKNSVEALEDKADKLASELETEKARPIKFGEWWARRKR